jgi:hypothetical protein
VYEGFGLEGSQERDGSVVIPKPAHHVFERGAAVHRAGGKPGQSSTAHTAHAQKVAIELAVTASFESAAHAAAVQAVQWGVERSSNVMQPSMLGAMPPPPPALLSQQNKSAISKAAASHGGRSGPATQTQTKLAGSMNRILASSKAAPKPVFSGSSNPISTATGRYAMIGGVLVDVARLDANIAGGNSSNSNKAKTAAAQNQQAKRKASALDAEIEMLLNKSSSHEAEAENSAFATTIKHMDNHAKRECKGCNLQGGKSLFFHRCKGREFCICNHYQTYGQPREGECKGGKSLFFHRCKD